MSFSPLPRSATWQHHEARTGFEVAHFSGVSGGHHVVGCTTAEEDGDAWTVAYEVDLGDDWVMRSAVISTVTADGERALTLVNGPKGWLIDGAAAPHLADCSDVDLESSAMTNTFPAHRLALEVGERSAAPAAYVRATSLSVERLEQSYERLPDGDLGQRYRYAAPAFSFECTLELDASGLVVSYPGVAVRHD